MTTKERTFVLTGGETELKITKLPLFYFKISASLHLFFFLSFFYLLLEKETNLQLKMSKLWKIHPKITVIDVDVSSDES